MLTSSILSRLKICLLMEEIYFKSAVHRQRSIFPERRWSISNFRVTANSLTIGGSASGTTTYLQDGVRNFSLLTKTANLQPSIESVQEVSLVQSGASARFDQPSVVNVITKAGTNKFHGRLYDYLRNDALQTKGYFNVPKPPLRYNQFGANIGGPIFHNRLFAFFDYAGLRNNAGTTLYSNVPTLLGA